MDIAGDGLDFLDGGPAEDERTADPMKTRLGHQAIPLGKTAPDEHGRVAVNMNPGVVLCGFDVTDSGPRNDLHPFVLTKRHACFIGDDVGWPFGSYPVQCEGESGRIDGFEEVIVGLDVEGLGAELGVGGDEDDFRPVFQPGNEGEPAFAPELDIEEDQVRAVKFAGRRCRGDVRGFGDDEDVGVIVQQRSKPEPGGFLIIDQDGADP